MVSLVSGLGGPRGFGENVLERNDDGSTQPIDITPVFENGLNFFGTVYSDLYLNNNGSVTFNEPRFSFTPTAITENSGNPEITPYFGDVDTRDFALGPSEPAMLNEFSDGNSTGSNLVWWDVDTANDRLVFTWDDVGYFSAATNKLNAFQLIIQDRGDGDFDIEFRYEEIRWTTGNASGGENGLGGTVARAGWTAGTGDPTEFFELPQSGTQRAMLDLEITPGNTGQIGRWFFPVRNGEVIDRVVPPRPDNVMIGSNFGDPHLVTHDGVAYDFMATGEYVLTRQVGGGIEIQARFVEVAENFSETAAIATRLGSTRVEIDATDANPVLINGRPTEIEDFTAIQAGTGLIAREGDVYTIVYPGPDGVVNAGDERVQVTILDDMMNVQVELDGDRMRPFEGLLGNADGNPRNDLTFADGTRLARPLDFDQLYGRFRDDWRVDSVAESLFTYGPGEGPDTFFDPDIPAEQVTINDLDEETRTAAVEAARNAGLEEGTFNFNAAVIDFAVTQDATFLTAALNANPTDEDAGIGGELSPNQAREVAYLYEAALDRDGAIDLPGLNYWIDQRELGVTRPQVANFFLQSPEFTAAYGDIDTLSREDLVTVLFRNVLGRDPDQDGLDFWTGQPLDNVGLLLAFADSDENTGPNGYVQSLAYSPEDGDNFDWQFVG